MVVDIGHPRHLGQLRKAYAMADVTFKAPVKVDPASRPPSPTRGGRTSLTPAYVAWLNALEPGAEWEFAPVEDGATDNPISRLNTLRKIAKDESQKAGATRTYKIEAVPTVPNKRYRIFGSVTIKAEAPAANGKAPAAKAAPASA